MERERIPPGYSGSLDRAAPCFARPTGRSSSIEGVPPGAFESLLGSDQGRTAFGGNRTEVEAFCCVRSGGIELHSGPAYNFSGTRDQCVAPDSSRFSLTGIHGWLLPEDTVKVFSIVPGPHFTSSVTKQAAPVIPTEAFHRQSNVFCVPFFFCFLLQLGQPPFPQPPWSSSAQ